MIATLLLAWGAILLVAWAVCWIADRGQDEPTGNGRRTPEDPWEWTWHD